MLLHVDCITDFSQNILFDKIVSQLEKKGLEVEDSFLLCITFDFNFCSA